MPERNVSLADEFVKALQTGATEFNVSLSAEDLTRLGDYYEQMRAWNARLHLVAPCSPSEFAVRHVLESLLALRWLPENASVVDVGSGAGLPVVPCMIVRPDLRAVLVEASPKKAVFLREAIRRVGRSEQATVLAERFENMDAPVADVLTCRAIERFTEIFAALVAWASRINTLLLFGGESLRAEIERANLVYSTVHVPRSEQRFLFVVNQQHSHQPSSET
ncbi:MAG TPA: 16S rRNA (guanine(527)-N(7))-methyltransferase RsmG [Pyrinomonadaceae bacterium]